MQTVRYRTVLASLFILALILPISAFAYSTPGTGVVWSAADLAANSGDVITWNETANRWTATDTVFIAATDSVYIFENFYVDASSEEGWDIHIQGSLLIGDPEGESTDSVFITGEDLSRGDGAGGLFAQDGGKLYMNRVVVTGHGAEAIDDGVRGQDATIHMDGCRVTNWPGYALRLSGTNAIVLNTLFHDNHEYTVSANLGSDLEIRNSSLIRNNLATPNSGKTALSVGTQGANTAIIDSCYISGVPDNRSGGISVWNFTGTSQSAVITNTTVENCAFGVVVQSTGAYAEITDCVLINNTAYNNPNAAGSGISVYGGEAHASHNIISGNFWGVTVPAADTSVLVLGMVNAENYYDEGYNQIFENSNGGTTWGLFNNVDVDILAQNNYWGTTDLDEVAEVIYDESDDASKGLVTYQPIWDGAAEELPPVIDSFEPANASFDTWNNWLCTFSVQASDPDGDDANLTYQWNFDGEDWGTDSTELADFYGEGTIPVYVDVTDEQGLTVRQSWNVVINGASTEFTFTSMNPDSAEPHIFTNDAIEFSIEAPSISGEALYYRYWLGEDLVSETSTWDHTFDTEGTVVISATVVDTAANPSPRLYTSWEVTATTNSVGDETSLPKEFALDTYPNPFNAEMNVHYSLPSASQVQIAVYDLLGRQVAHFTPGLVQPGTHSWSFNGRELPSGLYFLKVDAGQWHDVRKVTLLK